MRQIGKKILRHFSKGVMGPCGVVLLFFLQFLWWLVTPSTLVPIWTLYLVLSLSFLVCAGIYGIIRGWTECHPTLATIDVVQYSVYNSQIILIVAPRIALDYGVTVSIFYRGIKDEAELLIAYGFVRTVSSGGYIQVELANFLVDSVTTDDFVAMRIHPHELLIKPYLTKDTLGY